MRPIDKGPCPQIDGKDKTVNKYAEWRKDLIDRIGSYCVYCNMPITHSLQVEHVIPKNPRKGEAQGDLLSWDNMLLACGPCNRAKWNKPSNEQLHYLPESHNTLIPFKAKYIENNPKALVIEVNHLLTNNQTDKAQETINLFKFENIDPRDEIVDLRWMERAKEKLRVNAARELLDEVKNSPGYNADLIGKLIALQATGFFFLWFKEFENEPNVIKWLIHPDCFPGVAQICFDKENNYKLLNRNPYNKVDPI